jgi:hypothetical protein
MSDPDIVEAWLANQALERLQDYLKRGRSLAATPLGTLNGRWVYLMRTWGEDVRGKADHREREDIEAELQLRKVKPPFDLVKDAMAVLRQKSKEAMAELERDPERLAREERDLAEKIASFEATTKGPTN